jgi:methylphosphotriester-DNA--protein-cysteine methyltransferase
MRKPKHTWNLIGADGKPRSAKAPGEFGGHRRTKIYGRLDCRAALQAIARGGYIANRVFFASERDARAAGFRPCAVCMPAAYARWKADSN